MCFFYKYCHYFADFHPVFETNSAIETETNTRVEEQIENEEKFGVEFCASYSFLSPEYIKNIIIIFAKRKFLFM